jgi:hypothetical protein
VHRDAGRPARYGAVVGDRGFEVPGAAAGVTVLHLTRGAEVIAHESGLAA